MTLRVLDLDPARHQAHWLHGDDRVWQETNCAADLWIEALHALGVDPVAGLAFTLGTDFDGDQWRMFTFPPEDLRRLFGIEVDELNVWRPLTDHLVEQVALGRFVVIDVDAWHLPDTAGLTYHCAHQKTSVMVQMIDVDSQRLGYFHNAGYYELDGGDFVAVTDPLGNDRAVLPPFTLSVRLDRFRPDAVTARTATDLTADHLARRPQSNPVSRLRKRMEEDLPWLRERDLDTFHRYAFGTVRQCGANAELAASFVEWLDGVRGWRCPDPASQLHTVATAMKSIEFALARAVRGRSCALEPLFEEPETAWDAALTRLSQLVLAP